MLRFFNSKILATFTPMASAFSHALVAVAAGKTYSDVRAKFFLLGTMCAVIPDADVILLKFVAYGHPLGHRGFFHSFFFCALLAFILVAGFYRKEKPKKKFSYWLYLFLCGASHGLLDMLTNGGLGVAIFAPFDNTRYFFPWRPIQVSPIGAARFFTERGLRVIKSELVWIALPSLFYMLVVWIIKQKKKPI